MAIYSLRLTPIGKTTQKQPYTAAAHLRYIARDKAASHTMAERMPEGKVSAMRWLRREERADRANARVADKLVLALPRELARQHQIALVFAFAEALTKGSASWFAAIHAKGKDVDNPHCHLLVRDRDVTTGQRVVMFSAGKKEIAQRAAKGLSAPTTLPDIRKLWERYVNATLKAVGRPERVDCRSLKDQGITRPAQVHEGPNVRAMATRRYRPRSTARVVRNRAVRRRGASATRVVRYPDIDRGRTRLEYNAALRNSTRASAAMALMPPHLTRAATPSIPWAAKSGTAWVRPAAAGLATAAIRVLEFIKPAASPPLSRVEATAKVVGPRPEIAAPSLSPYARPPELEAVRPVNAGALRHGPPPAKPPDHRPFPDVTPDLVRPSAAAAPPPAMEPAQTLPLRGLSLTERLLRDRQVARAETSPRGPRDHDRGR